MAHYEPLHQDLRCLQIQLFSSLVFKRLRQVPEQQQTANPTGRERLLSKVYLYGDSSDDFSEGVHFVNLKKRIRWKCHNTELNDLKKKSELSVEMSLFAMFQNQ